MRAQRCSTLVCDVHALAPDAAAIDALARLQLAARRVGLEVRLCHASKELCGLLELVGLSDVLRVESGWQPEERKDGLGAEEERELDDTSV
jgi:ABC-type transporter Mla MlaB component